MRWCGLVLLALLSGGCAPRTSTVAHPDDATPIIWLERDVRSADLRYGAGSPDRAPHPPFRYLKEDHAGDSPKFGVTDANGIEWQVKLGPESQTETVATRLVWAAGYCVEEAYYIESARIEGLPPLTRGSEWVTGAHTVRGARFEPRRADVEPGKHWDWASNPFTGTRELDGLRVLMVLLNNYDTRAENNRVLLTRGEDDGRKQARYAVTDLGATFGRVGGMGGRRRKNDLAAYGSSRFISGVRSGKVRFAYRTRPERLGLTMFVFNPFYVASQFKKQRDMQDVPVANARWIGSRLARLSGRQLHDAFGAAGYDRTTAAGFVDAVRARIRALAAL